MDPHFAGKPFSGATDRRLLRDDIHCGALLVRFADKEPMGGRLDCPWVWAIRSATRQGNGGPSSRGSTGNQDARGSDGAAWTGTAISVGRRLPGPPSTEGTLRTSTCVGTSRLGGWRRDFSSSKTHPSPRQAWPFRAHNRSNHSGQNHDGYKLHDAVHERLLRATDSVGRLLHKYPWRLCANPAFDLTGWALAAQRRSGPLSRNANRP